MTPPEVDPARVEAVRDLLATLDKTLRDHRTYPPNNPILARRRQELLAKFSAFLGASSSLPLRVAPEALLFEGEEVYRGGDPRESLASRLYRQGVREIRFLPDLTSEELEHLLEVFNCPVEAGDLDEDVVTLLWERDLRHVRLFALDDFSPDAGSMADPAGTVAAHVLQLRESADPQRFQAIQRAEGVRPPLDPRQDLAAVSLNPYEIRALAGLLEHDERRDLPLDVVEVLLQVLQGDTDPEQARELLRILQRVVELSLDEGSFGRAATVLQHLVGLAARCPPLAPAIQPILTHFSNARSVQRVVERIKDGLGFDEHELHRYLVQLRPPAAGPLAESFEVVTDRKTRKVLCDAIAQLVKDRVGLLAAFTKDQRWFVARNVAYILGLTRNPESLRSLKLLARHPHERVRTEVVRAATAFPAEISRELVLQALTDADRSVRLTALDLAPGVGDAVVAGALAGMICEKSFARRDPDEKRLLAIALGRTAREDALALLGGLLERRGLLRQRKLDDVFAGVAGIAAIGTPAAQEALRRASADPEISEAVGAFLAPDRREEKR